MKIRCLYNKLVPISELKLNPKNRNRHPQQQIERLAKILSHQGWRYCVKVSNQSGMVTSGHGRVEAAILLGYTHVPVNYQDYDDAEMEFQDSIADNSIASWAELDLSGIHTDIGDLGPFDVDLLGIEKFLVEPAEKELKDDVIDLSQQWIVSLHCTDEQDMQKVYDEMTARGYECDLIT